MQIRVLNILALYGISLALLVAFYFQLLVGALPCPLCLLQRGCFIALGVAFMLNLQFGSSPAHYAMMLASTVLGAGIAMLQMLSHIAPGDPGYGSTLFGFHLYSWAFAGFCLAILYVAAMLIAEAATDADRRRIDLPGSVGRLAMWLFALLVAANLVSTLLECGLGACPANPTSYEWIRRFD